MSNFSLKRSYPVSIDIQKNPIQVSYLSQSFLSTTQKYINSKKKYHRNKQKNKNKQKLRFTKLKVLSHFIQFCKLTEKPKKHKNSSMENTKESGEQYLKRHRIEELLENIITSLLDKRPANPKLFISQMLTDGSSLDNTQDTEKQKGKEQDYKKEGQKFQKIEPESKKNVSTSPFPSISRTYSQQQAGVNGFPSRNRVDFLKQYNEAEYFIGTRRFSAVSPETLFKSRDFRRKAFSSKSISQTNVTIPVVEKTEEEKKTIETIIKKVSFLSYLKTEQVTALVKAMFEKKYHKGDVIIKQGDAADNFYILHEGVVDILKKGEKDAEEKKITELGVGSYFGELALMSGGCRAATVVAQTECRCWAIDQTTYLYLLRDVHYQRRQKCRDIIAKVPLLADLPDYEALLVAENLVVEDFPANTELVKQGDKGDKFYLIINGDADVLINQKKVNELHTGSFFGELALVYNIARAATVVSTTPIKVAYITGQMCRKVLEKCSSTLKISEQSYHTTC